jgi:5-oxoprolinase (ATP-hydrolysing)
VIREIRFKEKVEVNILSQHRVVSPYGLKGGMPGSTGVQKIVSEKGAEKILRGMDSATAEAGDRIVIYTPGGGGYGKP